MSKKHFINFRFSPFKKFQGISLKANEYTVEQGRIDDLEIFLTKNSIIFLQSVCCRHVKRLKDFVCTYTNIMALWCEVENKTQIATRVLHGFFS